MAEPPKTTTRVKRRGRRGDPTVIVNVAISLSTDKCPNVSAPAPASTPAPSAPVSDLPPPAPSVVITAPVAIPVEPPPSAPEAPPAPPAPHYPWYSWRQLWRFLKACGRGLVRVMNRIGLELQDDAKHCYKFLTFWGFVALMSAPDLYNLAIENHLIDGKMAPARLTYIINLIAFMGAAGKVVKIRKAQQDG